MSGAVCTPVITSPYGRRPDRSPNAWRSGYGHPHPDIDTHAIPLQIMVLHMWLVTTRTIAPGNLTGTDSLIEIPTTQTMPLVLMRKREEDKTRPIGPTMILATAAPVPFQTCFSPGVWGQRTVTFSKGLGSAVPYQIQPQNAASHSRKCLSWDMLSCISCRIKTWPKKHWKNEGLAYTVC